MNNKITIRFELTDEYDNFYTSESTTEAFRDIDETPIDIIGEQLNVFLRQCGYVRKK